jgi:type-F conjugative transfer system protein TrbI
MKRLTPFFRAPASRGVLLAIMLLQSFLMMGYVAFHNSKASGVCVNKKALVARFVGQLSQHTLSDDELRQKTVRFRDELNASVHHYADEKRVVVMDTVNRLAGGVDITDVIARDVAQRMRGSR